MTKHGCLKTLTDEEFKPVWNANVAILLMLRYPIYVCSRASRALEISINSCRGLDVSPNKTELCLYSGKDRRFLLFLFRTRDGHEHHE